MEKLRRKEKVAWTLGDGKTNYIMQGLGIGQGGRYGWGIGKGRERRRL